MTRLHRMLAPLALALAACAGTATVVVRDDSPPAQRSERAEYRPGHVYIEGHWIQRGDRWAWSPGYYERERPGHVYIEGSYRRYGNRHVWVDGQWRRRGGVVIR